MLTSMLLLPFRLGRFCRSRVVNSATSSAFNSGVASLIPVCMWVLLCVLQDASIFASRNIRQYSYTRPTAAADAQFRE